MAEPALQRYADAAREVAGDDSWVSEAAGSPFGVGQYDDSDDRDAVADLPSAAVQHLFAPDEFVACRPSNRCEATDTEE